MKRKSLKTMAMCIIAAAGFLACKPGNAPEEPTNEPQYPYELRLLKSGWDGPEESERSLSDPINLHLGQVRGFVFWDTKSRKIFLPKGVEMKMEDESIATAGSIFGVFGLTGKSKGTTKLTLEVELEDGSRHSHSFRVEVSDEPGLQKLELKERELKMLPGEERSLSLTMTPERPANREVTWKSRDPEIARVDKYGQVTALKPGKTRIRVVSDDEFLSAECAVEVVDLKALVDTALDFAKYLNDKAGQPGKKKDAVKSLETGWGSSFIKEDGNFLAFKPAVSEFPLIHRGWIFDKDHNYEADELVLIYSETLNEAFARYDAEAKKWKLKASLLKSYMQGRGFEVTGESDNHLRFKHKETRKVCAFRYKGFEDVDDNRPYVVVNVWWVKE